MAAKLWAKGKHDEARGLFASGVAEARFTSESVGPAPLLSEWAYFESTIGNRDAFEDLYSQIFTIEPDVPMFRRPDNPLPPTLANMEPVCNRGI